VRVCVRVCNWRGCGTFEKVRAHMLTGEFWRGKLSLKQGGNKKWSDVEIETMNQKLRNMSLSLSTFTKYHLGTTTQL